MRQGGEEGARDFVRQPVADAHMPEEPEGGIFDMGKFPIDKSVGIECTRFVESLCVLMSVSDADPNEPTLGNDVVADLEIAEGFPVQILALLEPQCLADDSIRGGEQVLGTACLILQPLHPDGMIAEVLENPHEQPAHVVASRLQHENQIPEDGRIVDLGRVGPSDFRKQGD